MTIYHCQRNNRSIRLTEELAHSGEAKVWRTDFQGYLAKIYHDPHNERIEKLQVMVRHIPADPNAHLKHISFAWPYSILEDSQGEIVGFLMPEVVGSETLLKLCTPQLRRKLKLETNWYFLHVVARNVAGIIQAIHREGYVLGDIKLENILVNNRALPTIIDTDSFQVPDPHGNKIYRCLVGSEGFTPAELMGVDIASVNQTEVHDRFRLGVVIYYLLFGGPPFRGMWQGSGEPPEQSELIRRGLWPFSSDNLILPSQTTIPLEILHSRLQALFLQCFNKGYYFPHKRPTAGDWLEALEVAFNELASCGKVDSHFYSLGYGHCYWCDRAKDFGVDIFPGNAIAAPKPKPIPVPPPKPLAQPKIAQKVSSPKIIGPPSNPPVKLWPRRKVLVGLGMVTVGGLGSTVQNNTGPRLILGALALIPLLVTAAGSLLLSPDTDMTKDFPQSLSELRAGTYYQNVVFMRRNISEDNTYKVEDTSIEVTCSGNPLKTRIKESEYVSRAVLKYDGYQLKCFMDWNRNRGAAKKNSFLTSLKSFKPERPSKNNKLHEHTITIPIGEVTKMEGSFSILETPAGEQYKVDAIPPGKYRDIRIVGRQLTSYTRIPYQVKPEECGAYLNFVITPPHIDLSACRER